MKADLDKKPGMDINRAFTNYNMSCKQKGNMKSPFGHGAGDGGKRWIQNSKFKQKESQVHVLKEDGNQDWSSMSDNRIDISKKDFHEPRAQSIKISKKLSKALPEEPEFIDNQQVFQKHDTQATSNSVNDKIVKTESTNIGNALRNPDSNFQKMESMKNYQR